MLWARVPVANLGSPAARLWPRRRSGSLAPSSERKSKPRELKVALRRGRPLWVKKLPKAETVDEILL
jgi:hypothetical protein